MTSQPEIPPKHSQTLKRKLSKHLDLLLGLGTIALVFIVARPIIMLSSNSSEEKAVAQERVLPVKTITVKPVDSYQVSRTYTGKIAALRNSNLGFSRGGEIERVLVREGDRVTPGQSLARLDIRNLQTQRQQLVAQKEGAQAQLAELQTGARIEDIDAASAAVTDIEQQLKLQAQQRTRREFLYNQGAISQEELDEFSFGEGALQARLKQAKSNLAELQNGTRPEQIAAQQAIVNQLNAQIADLDVTIDKSTLKAPFNGVISQRELDEGTVVNAGQTVISLIENTTPEARIGLPDRAIEELTIGSLQTIKLGGETYQATVASILPEVNANTRTQTVVLNLEDFPLSRINPGQTVRLELAENINAEGYWLPTSALTQGIRGLWNAYTVASGENGDKPDGMASLRIQQHSVEIVHQQGDKALVRGTLKPGDRIVTDGVHRLVPGQRVSQK